MKILGRIAIILIAALAIAGAATTLIGNSSTTLSGADPRPVVQEQPDDLSAGSPDRFHEGDHNAPSLFGVVDIIKNLVIMSLTVGVVTLLPRLKGLLARLAGPSLT